MPVSARRACQLAFFVCCVFVLYMALAPVADKPPVAHADKLNHLAAFFALALIGAMGWPGSLRPLLWGLAGYGAAIELLQLWAPGHQADPLDLLADGVGAMAGVAVFAAKRAWRERRAVGRG
jgi:VanZ family protein